jgi:hypothetical protein
MPSGGGSMKKITVNHSELAELEALLPESVKLLIHVLGYTATATLINQFGGVSLSGKSGTAKERTGGVHAKLREVLTEEELDLLIAYLGAEQFYIPRCSKVLRELRNARFIAAVAALQAEGTSLRLAMSMLCPEFGFSDRIGWKLISKSAPAPPNTKKQLGLFD